MAGSAMKTEYSPHDHARAVDDLQIAIRAVELYDQRHPRPRHVTIGQAAEMLELSRPTVRKIMQAGKLRLNSCGLIPIEQVDRLLLADSP